MKQCVYCSQQIARVDSTRDHVPSKCFLEKPYPKNLLTVTACQDCNASFKVAEEYAATFLGFLFPTGQNEPLKGLDKVLHSNSRLDDQLVSELKIENFPNCSRIYLEPCEDKLRLVFLKNAKGHIHCFDLINRSLTAVQFRHFQLIGLSSLSRNRLLGFDAFWNVLQVGVYRYRILLGKYLVVQSVLRENLFSEVTFDFNSQHRR